MDALIFIKIYHKKYLVKSKIDNSIYDNENHNYKYYYNLYCVYKKILKSNSSKYPFDLYVLNNPIIDNLIIPIEFNKYRYLNMPNYNLIFNSNFNYIKIICGKKIIINGTMTNLNIINNFEELIINNKTGINDISLYRNAKIIFNYEINNKIAIDNFKNYELILINKTNKEININYYYSIPEYDHIKFINEDKIIKPHSKYIYLNTNQVYNI